MDRPVLTLEGDTADMGDPEWLLGLAHADMVVVTVGDGPDAEREVCAWVDFCRSNPDDAAEVAADLLASGRWVGGGGAAPEVTVVRA